MYLELLGALEQETATQSEERSHLSRITVGPARNVNRPRKADKFGPYV